jgi:hypothetical protein
MLQFCRAIPAPDICIGLAQTFVIFAMQFKIFYLSLKEEILNLELYIQKYILLKTEKKCIAKIYKFFSTYFSVRLQKTSLAEKTQERLN